MKKLLPLMVVLLLARVSWSQDSAIYLSMKEAIMASVSNNNAARLSALDVQVARIKLRQSNTIFLPQLNFSYTAVTTNNPLHSFGAKLQQQSITDADFNPRLLNNPPATPDFSAKFELQQSLLNMDMIYQRKGAAKEIEMYQLISERTKEQLGFETEKAYLQLQMAYDAGKVLQEAFSTAKAVYKTSKDYYDGGLIQRSDLLNAEVHVMNIETQLKNAASTIEDASDMLSLFMNKPTGKIYLVEPVVINTTVVADSLQLPGNRADFKAVQKGIEEYDLMIKSSKMSYLPGLNAFAAYQLNDNSMFGFNANAYLAGIRLSWNIFNGNRTRNTITRQYVEKEKLGIQLKQQKDEAAVQLNYAKHQLSTASFTIKQASLAVEQSLESLRVLQNRYSQGLVKTSDVLMAQTQLAQQKLNYVQAVFNYNLAVATILFLTTAN